MKEIPLTRGLVAVVDDCDAELVGRHRWHAAKRLHTFYAATNIRREDGTRTILLMHRMIMGCTRREDYVDHWDGDGLRNVRPNLRRCTHTENMQNAAMRKNKLGRKGVSYSARHGRYYARICDRGKQIYLGHFATAVEAHGAYRQAATERFGEFARFE